MKLTITTRVISRPFVGTRMTVNATASQLKFAIQTFSLARGSTVVTVDWGDGTVETLTKGYNVTHTYAAPGSYEVIFSDDLMTLIVCAAAASVAIYPPMIGEILIASEKFTALSTKALQGLVNITSLDLSRSGITALGANCCLNCTRLETVIAPKVSSFATGSDTAQPFAGCTALREIRFAAANRSAIESSAAFMADPHLGAPNAVISFY